MDSDNSMIQEIYLKKKKKKKKKKKLELQKSRDDL